MEKERFNIDLVNIFIVGLLALVVLSIVSLIVINSLDDSSPILQASFNETILSSNGTSNTLTYLPVTFSAIRKNKTWLEFDGTNDNAVSIRYDTISFWYKNTTVNWTFIVNSSGTIYVNGSLGTAGIYPVYDDGSNMFLGKIDGATFFNGSIDDFRGYNNSIDAELVNLTYYGGRL